MNVANTTHNICLEGADGCLYSAERALTIANESVRYVQCYDVCPSGTFLQTDGKTCGATCASGFYESGADQDACVDGCASPRSLRYPSRGLVRCVGECPAGSFLVSGGVCAREECADGEFYDLASRSCTTKQRCVAAGRYLYAQGSEYRCITASECAERGAKAFATIGACYDVWVSEADFAEEGNVYECRDAGKYNVFTLPRVLCISREKCTENGLYLY